MLSEKRKESLLVLWISKIAKRIYDMPKFNYYALSDGIYAFLPKSKTGIKSFIKPRSKIKQSQQLMIAAVLICPRVELFYFLILGKLYLLFLFLTFTLNHFSLFPVLTM